MSGEAYHNRSRGAMQLRQLLLLLLLLTAEIHSEHRIGELPLLRRPVEQPLVREKGPSRGTIFGP